MCETLLTCVENNILFEEIKRCHEIFKLENITLDEHEIIRVSRECGFDNSKYEREAMIYQARLISQANKIIDFLKNVVTRKKNTQDTVLLHKIHKFYFI